MTAYYNEHDPYAAQWIRNLIDHGHVASGVVDERDVWDVTPDDVRGFTQCHFFAGIGIWSHSLRLAGWADDRPVWTASCPCQPFSAAGKGVGFADERHLWPAFFHLVDQCRPPVIFGEQVASKAVEPWVDLVQDDMEALDYSFGAIPFPAASVGAPHIRDRLYWVAYREDERHALGHGGEGRSASIEPERLGCACGLAHPSTRGLGEHGRAPWAPGHAAQCDATGERLAHPDRARQQQHAQCDCGAAQPGQQAPRRHDACRCGFVGDTEHARLQVSVSVSGVPGREIGAGPGQATERAGVYADGLGDADSKREGAERGIRGGSGAECARSSFWSDAEWIACRDRKARPTKPGIFPLAHGYPKPRVGMLRAAGNAIVAPQAAEWVRACMECRP